MAEKQQAEQRVLIASGLDGANTEGQRPIFLDLAEPRTGATTNYLLAGGLLQECSLHQPKFSSWFINDNVLEDGGLNLCTLVDPLFIVLPALDKARSDGNFCDLEQCLECIGCPNPYSLVPLLQQNRQMECVCDVKALGVGIYYRLNDTKVLTWLCLKVQKTKAALAAPGTPFATMEAIALTAYAAGLLGEYISVEWSAKLAKALGLGEENALNTNGNGNAPAGYNPDSIPAYIPDAKRSRLDPAAAAKAKAAESRQQAKVAKLAKEASGMRKLSSFFGKKG